MKKSGGQEHFFFLDVIRFFSSLLVFLFHFNMNIWQVYPDKVDYMVGSLFYFNLTMGDIAISLFIILSGVTLVLNNYENFNITLFLKKRFVAIYPTFWSVYIIVGVLYLIAYGHFVGDGEFWKIILTIAGLDGFFLYKMTNYYLVGEWYTGYMILTYLFYPLLVWGVKNYRSFTLVTLLLVFFIVNVNYGRWFQLPEVCNPISRLPDFLFGVFYGIFIINSRKKRLQTFIVSLLILLLSYVYHEYIPQQVYMLLFGCCFFSILFYFGCKFPNKEKVKSLFSYLGRISFVFFLVHHQIIYFFFAKVDYSSLSQHQSDWLLFKMFITTLIMAAILDRLLKPINALFRKKILK